MNKLTVYGLPLNPMPLLEQLRGASFCVSYATRDKLGRQLDQAIELVGEDQILLIDNGAFSAHKAGISALTNPDYVEDFEAWAQDILDRCPQAIAVIPDVIGGTTEQNAELVNESQLPVERSMPIWHMHEPIQYLLDLCECYNYVGIGSSGDYWQTGTAKWHARIREALAAIDAWEIEGEGAYVRPRLHMMRAQAFAHLYPFDSSDSTNVAMNHARAARSGSTIAQTAARVNGKIQASAGPAADHQVKRPLLDHVEAANLRAIWFLEAAGYCVREPLVLDQQQAALAA